jgi:hypothetical protein
MFKWLGICINALLSALMTRRDLAVENLAVGCEFLFKPQLAARKDRGNVVAI